MKYPTSGKSCCEHTPCQAPCKDGRGVWRVPVLLPVHLALVAVQILFGLWPVAGAAVLHEISPLALSGFRVFFGAPLLALAAGLPWRPLPSARDLGRLAVLAALGVSVNQVVYVYGLARAGPVNAGILVMLLPPLTLCFATLLGHERPQASRLAGVVIALAGAAVLLRAEHFDLADARLSGGLLLVASGACYSAYLVLARSVVARLGALPTVAWVFVLGALEALPWTAGPVAATRWAALPGWALGALAFVLIGPTLLTYVLNAWALQRVESSFVAVYVYLQPLATASTAALVLRSELPLRTLIGGLVVCVGVGVSSLPRRRGALR